MGALSRHYYRYRSSLTPNYTLSISGLSSSSLATTTPSAATASTTRLPPPPPPPHACVWDMTNSSPQFPPSHPGQLDIPTLRTAAGAAGDDDDPEKERGRPRCEWDFILSSIVSPARVASSDTLGVIEFDPSDALVATGGIARKIRIYSIASLLGRGGVREGAVAVLDHASAYDSCICTPAKLSSLRWKPDSGSRVIGAGDYDGVVTEYDLERRVPTFERDEHGGRRVWSVDYTRWDPSVGASGSDDGTVQLWDTRCEAGSCMATVRPGSGAAVCSVEFNPFGGSLVAVGCADRRAYGYDVRKLVEPLMVFDGHAKTVTYLRFLDRRSVVSASTDGSLKLWSVEDTRAVRTYRGHVNSRSFVGLSVWRNGGLLGCGSESNEVFVYDRRWGEPIWVHGINNEAACCGGGGGRGGFVSSICWRQVDEDECTLVAGGSDGELRVIVGQRRYPIRPPESGF